MPIPELSREKTRLLRSLLSGKLRRKRGQCLVEGERALAEAGRAGRLLYLLTAADDTALLQPPGDLVEVPVYLAEKGLFRELSDIGSGIGLIGVAEIPPPSPIDILAMSGGAEKLLLLDGLQDPGNVGTLVRTAWALGFAGVLLGAGTADPFGRKAVRASAGAVFHLPLVPGVGPDGVDSLLDAGFSFLYAESGGEDYRTVEYPEKGVLALGNEGGGLSQWVKEKGLGVGIPMVGTADSLNVVVAGAIIASRMVE